jgi:hypothetical protein
MKVRAYTFEMSSQVQELIDGVKTGRWLLPSSDLPNPVSVARAISGVCGGRYDWDDSVAENLRSLIGEPQHLVFVIADGFGMNFVDTLPEDSFVRRNLAIEGRAAFPSSTGANLFAYARGQWPGQHGKLGWYVYLPELEERVTLFLWQRTSDGKDLSELGITPEIAFPGEPFANNFSRNSQVLIPDHLVETKPTKSMHGRQSISGYSDLKTAVDTVVGRIDSTTEPTFTHLYWPQIDSTAHGNGSTHSDTLARVGEFESEMSRLNELLQDDSKIIITADHGHSDSPKNRRFRIDPSGEIGKMLESAPAGESRFLYLRVKPKFMDRFAARFLDEYGEFLFLFTADEVIELNLLGAEGVSKNVRERMGDFVAVTKGAYSIEYCAAGDERMLLLESTHGGLTPEEMLVPIVIA